MKTFLIILEVFFVFSISFGQLIDHSYQQDNQLFKGLYGKSLAGKAGVLILPAWKGIDNEARAAALNLQSEGYFTFVADIYGVGNIPESNQEAAKSASYYKTNYEIYQKRIKIALQELIKLGADPKRIVVIGYCFGGTGALESARGQFPVSGVVSIHGSLSKGERPNVPIGTKVLVQHGADDASVPQKDIDALVEELKYGKTDWQMIYYANSKHTYTNPESPDYNEQMAKRSWDHLLLFLKEVTQ